MVHFSKTSKVSPKFLGLDQNFSRPKLLSVNSQMIKDKTKSTMKDLSETHMIKRLGIQWKFPGYWEGVTLWSRMWKSRANHFTLNISKAVHLTPKFTIEPYQKIVKEFSNDANPKLDPHGHVTFSGGFSRIRSILRRTFLWTANKLPNQLNYWNRRISTSL
jgi:hypothetical protein